MLDCGVRVRRGSVRPNTVEPHGYTQRKHHIREDLHTRRQANTHTYKHTYIHTRAHKARAKKQAKRPTRAHTHQLLPAAGPPRVAAGVFVALDPWPPCGAAEVVVVMVTLS